MLRTSAASQVDEGADEVISCEKIQDGWGETTKENRNRSGRGTRDPDPDPWTGL